MTLEDTLANWNSVTKHNSTQNYTVPTAKEIETSFIPSSSGSFNFSGLSTGLKFGGSILSGLGAIQEGEQAAGAYEYNAALSMQQDQLTEDQLDSYGELLAGTQKAMYAKAGVELSGSPVDVMLESATHIEMDKQTARYNALSKAQMYQYEADMAESQGHMKAGMSFLSGAASLFGFGL